MWAPLRRPGRRGSRSARPVLVALIAAACGVSTGPEGRETLLLRERVSVSTEYRTWWNEISACSGLEGDVDAVRFFRVTAPLYLAETQFPCGEGLRCNGLWEAPHDISIAPAYLSNRQLVEHEMLHDLLGAPGHPPVFEECEVDWGGGHPDLIPAREGAVDH